MSDFYDAESREEYVAAMQRRINDGSIWHLEGSAGRAAMDLLDNGECMLGPRPCIDYWGNRIPARDEVKDGTKGSPGFVVLNFGEDHLAMLEGV